MYQFIRQLSQRHEVWCLSLTPGAAASAAAQPLAQWCNLTLIPAPRRSLAGRALTTLLSPLPDMALRAPSPAYHAALGSLLKTISFDVVQAESIEMAQYALVAQQHGTFATLDQWNAEYVLQRRAALTDLRQPRKAHGALYSLIQWQKLARYERMVCNRLDQVYVVSAEDALALKRIAVTQSPAVIPNGVDTSYFAPPAARSIDPNLLLFTGTLDFRPNIDAVEWFVKDVLPRIRREWPAAYLRVVGRAPAPAILALAAPGVVEVTGAVDDIRPHFAAAAAYVLPMRIGGGVRLKLLEAFATATPLISTTMGADGVEGLQHERHCLLADDAAAFARATVQVLHDRRFASAIAHAGRDLARQHYDWQTIIPRLEADWMRQRQAPS
jgi:glycosyltransferase involved in cell wall biosynthesis